jgi:hypothetical protein
MLQEIKLLVARRGPEIISIVGKSLLRFFSLFADDGNARFLAEGRIR